MIAGAVAQQAPKHVHMLRQIPVADRFLGPDAQSQRFFADHGAARLQQMSKEQRQSFGYRSDGRSSEEQPSQRVESKVAEAVDPRRGGRYRCLVRGMHLKYTPRTGQL